MKRFSFITLSIVLVATQISYGIGISPARWTVDLPENGLKDYGLTYSLSRPSTQYSSFTVSDPAGLDVSITGWSGIEGMERMDDNSILIDWNALGGQSASAYVNVRVPDIWQSSVNPGSSYLGQLVDHREVRDVDSGIGAVLSVVSQINFFRNYAPRINMLSLTKPSAVNQAANLTLQFEDKQDTWGCNDINRSWFSYEIDWESDGIIDQSGGTTFDEAPTPHPSINGIVSWTGGLQTSTLSLNHIFDTSGSYLATINVTDYGIGETTSMVVPIEVVPEPAMIALFGLGGLLIRKRRHNN